MAKKKPKPEVKLRELAAADGIELVPSSTYPCIGTRGPYGLEPAVAHHVDPLVGMAMELGGELDKMEQASRSGRARFDLYHEPSGTHIEVDEEQHFTGWRLKTLDYYEVGTTYGFDLAEYRALCQKYGPRNEKSGWANKWTPNFGPKGRSRQRAYYDAMKDLVLPALGIKHVIRIAVPERDVERVWRAQRERVLEALAR